MPCDRDPSPATVAGMNPLAVLLLAVAPTAIVDSVDGVDGIEPLTLVAAGTEIVLGDDGSLQLAYFASCVHETVHGGRVVVGVLGSFVDGGEVSRTVVDCDLPQAPGGGTPGALILRGGDPRAR